MKFATIALLAALSLAGCGPPDPFAEANAVAQSHVASDVTLDIDRASERRYDHADGSYTVCGNVVVNQPGVTDHSRERFYIIIRNGNGLAVFDGGGRSPDVLADFEENSSNNCKA